MPARLRSAFRILIVDTEHTGRAALAERLLRRSLAAHGVDAFQIRVTSAGLDAIDGARIDPVAAELITRHGGNADGFAARSLSAPMVAATDMLLTGTEAERDALVRRYPRAARRTFTMGELQHLYRAVVELSAPLREHPLILANRRGRTPVSPDWELPAWDGPGAHADAVGRLLDESCEDAAEIWSALVGPSGSAATPPSSGLTLDVFGTRLAVACTGERGDDLAREMHRVWSRCLVSEDSEESVPVEVHVGGEPEAVAAARARGALAFPDILQALHHFSAAATVRGIDRGAGSLVMLHAAGIASRDGDVIGFVAPSGTGKTTLARVLGAHYGYVTDETLAVSGDRVIPYPKPLSVITESHQGIKLQWSPDSLDLARPTGDLRLTRLVLLDRRPDAPTTPVLEDVPHLRGLAELTEQTSYMARLPRKLNSLSDTVDHVGGLTRLSYREAVDVLPLMPELLGER
ncbi:hypothetical protein [Demequina zhanjiangensis]|uniref:Phosphotyrosine protein phosphatase I domain-containing protein n=1 Tax=Demequina zhanjiangensis TaxID=3051659 RepID=A0ABT8FZ78_9MICO|nr:hypothetical protein [Demequina sp. SYSU T00b26]MDN4472014.1 hypothetical protein [Demequina sp. SYSU T00b26]